MQPYRPAYRNPSPDPDQDLAMLPPQNNYYSPVNPQPHPPQHRQQQHHPHDEPYYSEDYVPQHPGRSDVTAGADNYGHAAAGGGMTGLASGVAAYPGHSRRHLHDSRAYEEMGYQETMGGSYDPAGYAHSRGYQDHHTNYTNNNNNNNTDYSNNNYSSNHSNNYSNNNYSNDRYNAYQDNTARYHYEDPYRRDESGLGAVHPESINPHDIVDDGDDGFIPEPKRRSLLSMGHNSSHNNLYPGVGAGAAASGSLPGSGARSPAGASGSGSGNGNGNGAGAGPDTPLYNLATGEKKVFVDEERSRKKRLWIIGIIVALVLAGAIAGGVTAGILANQKASADPNRPGGSGSGTDDDKGDLGKDSKEIKALQSKDLHKVFPGMDYTPWGTQYPLCLKYPPSQNNVTRDIAVLSQLTNTVRLYGTDCNQTEMVLHAFERLELKQMKLWLGVWIDTNTTTNDRQIKQLYKILENTRDKSVFKGVIVGNEVLYRGKNDPSTLTQLMKYITGVKDELASLKLDLPIATSDLGDAWTQPLTKIVDVVMSNVHPFFAGVTADKGTGWAWSFWTEHDVSLTKGTNKKQIISEIGWPSGGGNNCGDSKCPDSKSGSVASVKDMNIFMENWVCQALSNGTDYFWFEAFDEPWKVTFNEPGKEWEDKWGLMDPARVLKPGIKIPDCGGKTVD